MQVGELVAMSSNKSIEKYCNHKSEKHNDWKSRVANYLGKPGDPSGTRLYKELEDHKSEAGSRYVAKRPGLAWDLDEISETSFPIQAHHLIPKKFLPQEKVTVFLAKKKKSKNYVLARDNYYDTDNFKNGYCMPYSSPLAEWRKARSLPKAERDMVRFFVSNSVMEFSGRQLHQGSHRTEGFVYPDPEDEQDDIETPGYLAKARLLLKNVCTGVEGHLRTCNHCCEGKSGKMTKVQPLAAVVRHVDGCSAIMMGLIKMNVIFVSEAAKEYAEQEGLIKPLEKLTKKSLKSAMKSK